MNTAELIQDIIKRLKKTFWLIAIIGAASAYGFYYHTKQQVVRYTSKATLFPLSGSVPSPGTIGAALGLQEQGSGQFGNEASINIIDLATSRYTTNVVAATRLPEFGNKMVAEMLIEENNKFLGYNQNIKINMPKDSTAIIGIGGSILRGAFVAKVGKTGILEMYVTSTNTELLRAITYIYVDRLSEFYVNLKKKKAQNDLAFAVMKADSLKNALNKLNARIIDLDEHTYFTNTNLPRYSIPKLDLQQEKANVQGQYNFSISNREGAAYKLQKETPIMEILDKPDPPYDTKVKSKTFAALVGFLLGAFVGLILLLWPVIGKYVGVELNKAIEKANLKIKDKEAAEIRENKADEAQVEGNQKKE